LAPKKKEPRKGGGSLENNPTINQMVRYLRDAAILTRYAPFNELFPPSPNPLLKKSYELLTIKVRLLD